MDSNVQFRVSSSLKNIIGKDLIADDFIAIFELVKNSYDAHAEHVNISFSKNAIVIQDDGKGMNDKDLLDKWLFVAYSAKELGIEDEEFEDSKNNSKEIKDYREKINLHRSYAGAKGIGRFSCDKLSSKLTLLSRKIGDKKYHQIDVDWDAFEQDPTKEFIDIDVSYSEPSKKLLEEYSNFEHGTVLILHDLRDEWTRDDKLELKRSLGKLINPFETLEKQSFSILISDPNELDEDEIKINHWDKVNGYVENLIIEILNIKTTNIEVTLSGNEIVSKLIDRGELIYEVKEENPYTHLSDVHFRLFFLNRAAKTNFTQKMGLRSLEFGHVFLYNNGFRVYPFGEPGDDSLGIDARHAQGYSRTLGTRDLLGSIEILFKSTEFQETSSRDGGLKLTQGYEELEQCFEEKVLKRLEKYVVDIQWAFKLDERLRLDKDSDNTSLLDTIVSKDNILTLITRLVDKQGVELINFNKDFLNIIDEKISEKQPAALNNLKKLAELTNDNNLLNEIEEAHKKVRQLQKVVLVAEKESREAFERQQVAEKKAEKAEREKKKYEQDAEKKQQQLLFLRSTIHTPDVEELVAMQHHINLYASAINGEIRDKSKLFRRNKSLTSDEILELLDVISFNNKKIMAISQFSTKAKFLSQAETLSTNVVSFFEEYIHNLYELETSKKMLIDIIGNDVDCILNFKAIEMKIVIDNLLSNSHNAEAKKAVFEFQKEGRGLLIQYTDNGDGLNKDILNPDDIFNMGYTTSRKGSGIGMYHIKEIINEMGGEIMLGEQPEKGIRFDIRFEKCV